MGEREAEGWLTARRWLGPVLRLSGSTGVGKVSRKGRGGRGEKGEPPMGEDGRGCFAGCGPQSAKVGGLAAGFHDMLAFVKLSDDS